MAADVIHPFGAPGVSLAGGTTSENTQERFHVSRMEESISYLTRKQAQDIDAELMGAKYGYSLTQLMELAGLACAQALNKAFSPTTYPRVLVCCGPGNQGGDGLVAARHLCELHKHEIFFCRQNLETLFHRLPRRPTGHFGHKPTVYYPKQTDNQLYKSLLLQCKTLEIPVIETNISEAMRETDVILDGIFGFSFHSTPRAPFDEPIRLFKQSTVPIVSIDIPSGWDVEAGNTPDQSYFSPDVLVSLTAPKLGVKAFQGRHFLGGRFVPPGIFKSYNLNLPAYPSSDQVVEITDITQEVGK
ncbi:hypothetical protein Pst134EA_033453 [Puccinia striiformis f. sp. tritici]|uniref:hypothetical protein n=1 Tax=Puccinia striiformis f. sp. tritici TaxID=168172 RepID=UPI002007343B|nr:hypothetical protein Pst134EA_033453 [Puccinia striiformis f. sp. tritici]KAH9465853.1 hypothetical protein Pst134EA_033453 [Puccinia striiformis f. sp. tritici]